MIFVTKAEALALFEMERAAASVQGDISARGPRGIVNARWLGLSKHRYRRPRPKKARVLRAFR